MKKFVFRCIIVCSFSTMHIFAQADRFSEAEQLARALRNSNAPKPVPHKRFIQYKDDMRDRLGKTTDIFTDAKYYLMNGNQIVGNIYDYGGIAPGDGLLRNVNNMVWRGLGDIYQFAPFVAAAVVDTNNVVKHISSDAINDRYARDLNPLNSTQLYGWRPLPEYVSPTSGVMASNPAPDLKPQDGRPDSWPLAWYSPVKGQYVWPGYLRQDIPNADLEVLWGMDDKNNNEYAYYPMNNDASIRGLGVKLEGRALQWSNALAQNCIFFVYTAQNYSDKDLDTVYFGMYGDVDVGGASTPENTDDLGFFISPFDTITVGTGVPIPLFSRSLVYLWDNDGKGYLNIPTHYNGCKFLESPGNPNDGIDNDADKVQNASKTLFADESQTDGIDNDGDWNINNDDVGLDGVPSTQDQGEGDGVPTAGKRFSDGTLDPLQPGEPHFELTDLDESDQIGLTAFKSWAWTEISFKEDEIVWGILDSNFNSSIPNLTDINFLYGSGKIALKKRNTDGSIKRFSVALLMGTDLNDLLITARTVQVIYNQNYQFIQPPSKPIVSAVEGDKKVTLFWDNAAELSVDPILGKDFEGYVIYRSTNPQFSDINLITDGFGSPLLYKPLTTSNGKVAKFDVAMRPEPFFETDTSVTKNGRYDAGEQYIDVNNNGKYDSTLVEDFYKGYAVIPYDQRGVSYYLGDNTGLVHSFVDSNKVINGQTYYYAVVSYDRGDITTYPPTESTKRINIDPITSQLAFDVNTVSVVPGPRAGGYVAPRFNSATVVTQTKGVATGKITIEIIDEMKIKDLATYEIHFSDSLSEGNKKVGKVNYAILKTTVTETDVSLFDTNFVKIGHLNIVRDGTLRVTHAVSGQQYVEGIDFILDTARGFLRKTGGGAMFTKNGPYRVRYLYYPQSASTFLANEEANPVFDGMKLYVKNEPLGLDTINSIFVLPGKNTLKYKTGLASLGTKNMKAVDMQIEMLTYDSANGFQPGDTARMTPSNQRVPVPFRFKNISKDTAVAAMKVDAMVFENNIATRNNKWDEGEPILFLTPIPLRSSANDVMYEVKFNFKDSLNKKFGGEVFHLLTTKPFLGKEKYSFSTQSAKFNATLASTSLDRIKVVPNPYVAVNDIEPTDRLPGTTRGSRRIYFEHLPPDCSIRIYTISGELVKELNHSTGIDNGREYWDLLNRDNLGIAYGIYIAHIQAKDVGEKTIKFAIIK